MTITTTSAVGDDAATGIRIKSSASITIPRTHTGRGGGGSSTTAPTSAGCSFDITAAHHDPRSLRVLKCRAVTGVGVHAERGGRDAGASQMRGRDLRFGRGRGHQLDHIVAGRERATNQLMRLVPW